MIYLHPNGTDDTAQLQDAADNSLYIKLAEGEFNCGEVFFRSGTKIEGSGKHLTTLKSLRKPGEQSVINIKNKEDIEICDLNVDGGETVFDYGKSGPYCVMASTGNGSSRKSRNVRLHNCRFHHTSSAIMCIYGGIDRWQVDGCDFEYAGRGGLNSNAMRNTSIVNSRFGATGDDPIMAGGNSYNVAISGCVFDQGSSFDITGAAGLKLHGYGLTVAGCSFWGCHSAIRVQEAPKMGWAEGYRNLGGSSREITIVGNTIYTIGNKKTQKARHPSSQQAIRLTSCDGVIIDGNSIYAVEDVQRWEDETEMDYLLRMSVTGNPRPAIQIQWCRNIRSSNNYICGSIGAVVNHSEFRSRNDQYDILGDVAIKASWSGDSKINIKDAEISDNVLPENVFVDTTPRGTVVESEIEYTSCGRRRIGFLMETASPGDTTLKLQEQQMRRGILVKRNPGDKLKLCSYYGHSEEVEVTDTAFRGETELKVTPIISKYAGKEAWLEWPDTDGLSSSAEPMEDGLEPDAEPPADALVEDDT